MSVRGKVDGMDGLLTAEQAAALLGLQGTTLRSRSWRVRHGLRSVKLGKSRRFRVEDVEAFIREGMKKS